MHTLTGRVTVERLQVVERDGCLLVSRLLLSWFPRALRFNFDFNVHRLLGKLAACGGFRRQHAGQEATLERPN